MGPNCMPCPAQNNFLPLFLIMMGNNTGDNSFMFMILLLMMMQPGCRL